MLVAVYGTLKKGHHNNHYLTGKKLIGSGVTIDSFVMINCGFPVIQQRDEAKMHPVSVEVWDIGDDAACLNSLDRLEGVARGMYYRKVVKVNVGDVLMDCSIYIGGESWHQRPVWPEYLRADGILEWNPEGHHDTRALPKRSRGQGYAETDS